MLNPSFLAARLCVVGNLNRDLRTAFTAPWCGILQDGETSVPFIRETTGGGGANTACAAALGARVAFLCKIGDDATGNRLGDALRRHGVEPKLARDQAISTGTSNLVFDTGQRHFISCLPNNESLAFGDLDPSVPPPLRSSLSDQGNLRELTAFATCEALEDALAHIINWGAAVVVVHMGAAGAGCYDGRALLVEPPRPPARHLNITGTGDVLSVCMMLQHRIETVPRDKLRLANRIVAAYIEGAQAFVPEL